MWEISQHDMNFLQNAIKLTPIQRKIVVGLVFILTLTSTQVQAASANAYLPTIAQYNIGHVMRDNVPTQGFVVPVDLKGTFPAVKSLTVVRIVHVTVTAYASVPGETDSTPFTTADGSHVRDGIVAANWLPFGTRIRMPELFGDKIFEVHDRMNTRFPHRVDIWVASVAKESTVGLRRHVTIEVLN